MAFCAIRWAAKSWLALMEKLKIHNETKDDVHQDDYSDPHSIHGAEISRPPLSHRGYLVNTTIGTSSYLSGRMAKREEYCLMFRVFREIA